MYVCVCAGSPFCTLIFDHFFQGHVLVDVLVPALLALNEFGVLQTRQWRAVSLNLLSNFSQSNFFRMFSLLSDFPPILLQELMSFSLSKPILFHKAVLGVGCKSHEGCLLPPDTDVIRAYIHKSVGITASLPYRTQGKCKAAVIQRVKKRRLMNANKLLDLVASETSCQVRELFWEDYSIVEQMQVASQLLLLIGVSSTSTHNLIYLPPGAALLDIVASGRKFMNRALCRGSREIGCFQVVANISDSLTGSVIVNETSFKHGLRAAWNYIRKF